jgi:transposase
MIHPPRQDEPQISAQGNPNDSGFRSDALEIEDEMYKWRHLIENYFQKLKEFKRIAMRCDKTDTSYSAMINLSAGIINSR